MVAGTSRKCFRGSWSLEFPATIPRYSTHIQEYFLWSVRANYIYIIVRALKC